MPGKIVWNIEFTGLDESLKKLKEIDRILQSISRHQGTSIFGIPGVPGGAPNAGGRNVIIPPTGRGGHTGAGAAVGTVGGGLLDALILKGLLKPNVISGPYQTTARIDPRTGRFTLGPMSQVAPPVMPPPLPENIILKQLHKFGQAMQATKIPGISDIGGMLVKLGKFGLTIGLITVAAAGLYAAFKMLLKGIEEASRIYQVAANTGIGVTKTSLLEQALRSMGITERATFQMESAMRGGASSAGIIGAARGSGFGAAQQLQNMGKEFAEAMKDAAYSASQMELSAKTGQLLFMDMTSIGREFKTLLSLLAADMYPILHGFLDAVKNLLQLLNQYMEVLLKIKEWVSKKLGIDLLPTGGPGTARWPGAGGGGLPGAGSWEKIGLVFGKGGFSTAMEQTAKNTKDTATNTSKTLEILKMILKTANFPFGGLTPSFAP